MRSTRVIKSLVLRHRSAWNHTSFRCKSTWNSPQLSTTTILDLYKPTDNILVDTNMIIHYDKKSLKGWNEVADLHLANGRNLWVLPRNRQEYLLPNLPDGFKVLEIEDKEPSIKNAIEMIKKSFVRDWTSENSLGLLKVDFPMLLESGFAMASGLPQEEEANGKTVLLTNNLKLLKLILTSRTQRETLETIVNRCGLEHLITVRYCNDLGLAVDLNRDEADDHPVN
eukprot:TRINITY_DN28337_c0_g1_i1.p1 TRINITY_DN28337_c0_g1~~TRINITY_DN28337_c0_g1_i1.p1  ORF type:complete len:226 (+),score=8.80 TRINITY_DN28337_c0_g1_i1:109-786(+)